jgi:pimeloyl-ACP methyl ester carboxylesterase
MARPQDAEHVAGDAAANVLEGFVASTDATPIHYKCFGDGERSIVFVHGWGCTMTAWDGQVSVVASKYRVVLLDLAGHGQSGKERRAWTMESFADDVCAVCEALQLTRVVLVGHSMGGPIILEAALRMTARVVGLVPIDILLDVDDVAPGDKRAALFAQMRENFNDTVVSFFQSLFPRDADQSFVDRIIAMETANDPRMMVPALENAMAYDARPALSRLKVPIHGINGDLSPTSLEHNRKYAPQYDAVVMTGVSHWLMLDRPEEFTAKLMDVLDGMKGLFRPPA